MSGTGLIKFPLEVSNYISKYGLDKWKLESNNLKSITTAVVVPVISEFENIKILLSSLLKNDQEYFSEVLIIFVVNNLKSSSKEVIQNNNDSINFLRSLIYNETEINSSGMQVALIDASSDGLEMPEKDGGVGLARKIGMDLALTVFDYTSTDKNILVCLDADCKVQNNYLSEIIKHFNEKNLSAAVINFEHDVSSSSTDNDETIKAIICYEIFLRYYVLGLKYAASPFAIHTIGSSMACEYQSYIKIEGMNKQKAAEDFYFLEKLAKNVSIGTIVTTTVYPSSRGSWRVPFGTGQRVNRFISHVKNEYLLYDPQSFEILKKWLNLFYSLDRSSTASYYLNAAKEIHIELYNFLVQQNFDNDWARIVKNSKSDMQINKQKSKWFDGFKTLKLIHHLRDSVFPYVNMFDALDQLFCFMNITFNSKRTIEIPEPQEQIEYLSLLRTLNKNNN